MKVCWLTLSPAPYTLKLFNEIGKSIDLSVVLFNQVEKNRNDEWKIEDDNNFKLYEIGKDYNNLINKLADECDLLVDGFYLSIYGYKAVNAFSKRNKKTVLIADGGIAKNRGILVNAIMSFLMKKHNFCFSSSEITDRYFMYYGVDKNKIKHYKFTSLTNKDISYNKELTKRKEELRKELKIDSDFVILSVGQPIKRKGFDILLESYVKSNLNNDACLYIVGGKPQEEVNNYVKNNNLKNVRFIELLNSEELKKYYAIADCFILCTREDIWGLVIEEAMSFGLPVITSDNCVCGLHFEKTGSCLICGVNDVDAYAYSLNKVFKNEEIRNRLSNSALTNIKEYTIEKSASVLVSICEETLN